MINSGLYIHIPFCRSKCPYCSFYSDTDFSVELQEKYIDKCLEEISRYSNSYTFDTVYIGGGTPSIVPPALMREFVNSIPHNAVEFTIEANPESVTADFAAMLNDTEINRVSMGVQSLNDDALKLLGRVHTRIDALKAYETIRKTSVKCSLDIMIDLPSIPYQVIKDTAAEIVSMSPDHVSAYSYMPDTGYMTDIAAEAPLQYNDITAFFTENGYPRYEVSNYATLNNRSLHNLKYWRMDTFIGVGAGAHSQINYPELQKRIRFSNRPNVTDYLNKNFDECGSDITEVTGSEFDVEILLFMLRTADGIDLKTIKLPDGILNKIKTLTNEGFLVSDGTLIRATDKGFAVLDTVLGYLYS